jgi:hypothetical protein
MKAISEAVKLIQRDPLSETAKTISSLILALESGSDFAMSALYALDIDDFQIALALIPAWRRQHLRAQKKLFVESAFCGRTKELCASADQGARTAG